MADTARVQYVFLDVVGFTRNRSVEAQSAIVETLNTVVSESYTLAGIDVDSLVLIPTGDGIAVGILDSTGIDTSLLVALNILQRLAEHNASEAEQMRRFETRIGINENIDNVVIDINGRRNVAGAGISMSQRIMDKADGGQVLVGGPVFNVLSQREKYMHAFRAYSARDKHRKAFPLYQYIGDSAGLNTDPPSAFVSAPVAKPTLTEFAAHYICIAAENRAFLETKQEAQRDYTATVLMGLLTEDAVAAASTRPFDKPVSKAHSTANNTFDERYAYYYGIDFWVVCRLADYYVKTELRPFVDCFEDDMPTRWAFASEAGIARVLTEAPEIAALHGIAPVADEA